MATKKRRQGVSGNPAKAASAPQGSGGTPTGGKASAAGKGSGGKGSGGKGSGAAGRAGGSPTGRSEARGAFERASAPVLLFLSRLPRWLFPVAMGALLLAGMLVPNQVVGGILLGLLTLLLLWLVALSWPLISWSARLLRLFVVVGLGLIAFGRATGRFG